MPNPDNRKVVFVDMNGAFHFHGEILDGQKEEFPKVCDLQDIAIVLPSLKDFYRSKPKQKKERELVR